MKNKIRLIDITILSQYMGRFLTAIVTAIVFAITVSALVSEGGIRRQAATLVMEVAPLKGVKGTDDQFEPFRYLLALETDRTVVLRERGADHCERCDLFVMPIELFLASDESHRLVPLYSIDRTDHKRDEAVVIARNGDPEPDVPSPGDIVFTNPESINGCWVQLGLLESRGYELPDRIDSLHFASRPGAAPAAGRVIFSVLLGEYPYGACRASDLAKLIAAGEVGRDELRIVVSGPTVPELVVACRPENADYYRSVLERVSARVALTRAPGRDNGAVELLKSRGMRSLRPVSGAGLKRAAELFTKMQGRI
jgi:hypothetical protein